MQEGKYKFIKGLFLINLNSNRGKKFIVEHLRMDDIICYWEHLLQEYAKLLKFKIEKNKNFKEIKK